MSCSCLSDDSSASDQDLEVSYRIIFTCESCDFGQALIDWLIMDASTLCTVGWLRNSNQQINIYLRSILKPTIILLIYFWKWRWNCESNNDFFLGLIMKLLPKIPRNRNLHINSCHSETFTIFSTSSIYLHLFAVLAPVPKQSYIAKQLYGLFVRTLKYNIFTDSQLSGVKYDSLSFPH